MISGWIVLCFTHFICRHYLVPLLLVLISVLMITSHFSSATLFMLIPIEVK